jgi:hypothetical protein
MCSVSINPALHSLPVAVVAKIAWGWGFCRSRKNYLRVSASRLAAVGYGGSRQSGKWI